MTKELLASWGVEFDAINIHGNADGLREMIRLGAPLVPAVAYGGRIAVGIDARGGKVAIRGWVDAAAVTALDLARRMDALGVATLVHTDVGTDGMLAGPNFGAQEAMLGAVKASVIASGGVARREDVVRLMQLEGSHPNLDGVIVGKAIYEGRVALAALLRLAAAGE